MYCKSRHLAMEHLGEASGRGIWHLTTFKHLGGASGDGAFGRGIWGRHLREASGVWHLTFEHLGGASGDGAFEHLARVRET